MEDWRGRKLEPGALVVYPGRASSSMWLIEAEVVDFTEREVGWNTKEPTVKVARRREASYGRVVDLDGKVVTIGLRYITVVDE